jgi:hypothetical protein
MKIYLGITTKQSKAQGSWVWAWCSDVRGANLYIYIFTIPFLFVFNSINIDQTLIIN